MITKVAISIWDNRISPVMDAAGHLLLVEIVDGSAVSRETVSIPRANIFNLVNFLVDLRINVLICGAISHRLEKMLTPSGIEIYPWCRGNVDEIIAAYCTGVLDRGKFLLPGRRRHRRQGEGRRCGQRAGFGRLRQIKEEG